MLTTEPTEEMLREWRRIHSEYRDRLTPNRKTGAQVNDHFTGRYSPERYNSPEFTAAVKDNIMLNGYNREKLPAGAQPEILTYKLDNGSVLVGIDLTTGFIHVECEDIQRAAEIYDDLFLYRGLDESDLNNCFLTAQYIQCQRKDVKP